MEAQTQAAPKKATRKEWMDAVSKSNGTRIMLSGDLEKAAVEFQKKLDEHVVRTSEFNKATAIFEHEKDVFFFNLRVALEKAGMADVWEKGLAFDNNAKKDGFMVINVSGQQ